MKRTIPKFKNIEDERKFWATHSLIDYLDELEPGYLKFPKPKHITISIKPRQLITLREIAFKKGISSSRLIKKWIEEKLSSESGHSKS